MAYVRAFFRGPNEITWLGQAYVGAYPNGSYALGVADVALGSTVCFSTLGAAAEPDESVRNTGDVWVDSTTGDMHGAARVDGALHTHYVPAGEAWPGHLQPVESLPGTTRARFLHVEDGPLMMGTSGNGVVARWVDPGPDIDWANAPQIPIEIPAEGFESPSAIHAMGEEYQSVPVTGYHLALCGQYSVADHEIWHAEIRL